MWSFWTFQERYFSQDSYALEVYHFYQTNEGYSLRKLTSLSLNEEGGLCPFARSEFKKEYPSWDYA